jgi:hypothetical protein
MDLYGAMHEICAIWLSTSLKLIQWPRVTHCWGERLTDGSIQGSCFLAKLHRRCSPALTVGGTTEPRRQECPRQGKPFFAFFLLTPGQKVGRLAGRDPPVLPLSQNQNESTILNFAGPGRQPGYFPCSSKESNQRKDVHLAVGTSVASNFGSGGCRK